MSTSELIAECEKIDKEATPGPWLHRSIGGWDGVTTEGGSEICKLLYNHPANATAIARTRTLLPLLVAVIKNQQRQIDAMRPLIEEVHELDSGEQDCIAKSCGDALIAVNLLSAELEQQKL